MADIGRVRKRGSSWNVIIRVDGERHEFGPWSEPLLGTATAESKVEEWMRRKRGELIAVLRLGYDLLQEVFGWR